MNEQIIQIAFILFFQLAGGVAIGSALRSALRRQFGCAMIFFAVWGFLFGGMPIGIGWLEFAEKPWLLPAQLAVFFGAISITAFLPEVMRDALKSSSVFQLMMGGLFGAVGILLLVNAVVDPTQLPGKLLSGGIFTLAGIAVFWQGFSSLGKE